MATMACKTAEFAHCRRKLNVLNVGHWIGFYLYFFSAHNDENGVFSVFNMFLWNLSDDEGHLEIILKMFFSVFIHSKCYKIRIRIKKYRLKKSVFICGENTLDGRQANLLRAQSNGERKWGRGFSAPIAPPTNISDKLLLLYPRKRHRFLMLPKI